MLSAKWQQFCLGLNVLKILFCSDGTEYKKISHGVMFLFL